MNHEPDTFLPRRLPYRWLSRSVTPMLLALSIGCSTTAHGELVITDPNPSFSASDLEAIRRNEALRAVVAHEPWLVFKILRDLEAATQGRDLMPPRDPGGTSDFDVLRDPDLDRLQRASPEAAHDLFLLLKKVGSAQPK